jgi:Ca2+:H+ antiporter
MTEPEVVVTTPRRGPRIPDWLRDRTVVVPLIGAVMVAVAWTLEIAPWLAVALAVLLAGSVLAAVHHAEVIAHRVGEPFGSLVLAVAVTVIEVALIVTLMVTSGDKAASLARDTVFAAVMITCNGVLGASVLIGALRKHVATFNAEGTATALATVAVLTTLTLVLPAVTTTEPGPEYAPAQLAFAAIASLALYAVSCSCRPSATATSSCPRTSRSPMSWTRPIPRIGARSGASGSCASRWWRSSGWRRSSRCRSRGC